MATANLELLIWRQSDRVGSGDWESYSVDGTAGTLLTALKKLNKDGAAIAFNGDDDDAAHGGMLVNGKPCLAEHISLSSLEGKVYLEPFRSFPLVKDLKVDMEAFAKDLAEVDALSPESVKQVQAISNCLRCGVCQEACPDYKEGGKYMGPAPILLMDWGNHAPGGDENKKKRLEMMTSDRGVHHDRGAFAFDIACPNELSLRRSMARAKRDASWHWLKSALEQ